MKKVSLLVFLVLAVLMSGVLKNRLLGLPEDYDIRKLKWEMSYEQVKEAEGLGASFYKSEDLLGTEVEVVFGADRKGLYSVIYSNVNPDPDFVIRATAALNNKYGDAGSDLDYSFLIESKDILKKYPRAVVKVFLENDYSELYQIEESYSNVNVKKIIKGGLTKRKFWTYGNTIVLLLDNVMGGVLSYRPKAHHEENKKGFEQLMEELKKQAVQKKKKKTTGKVDKF